MITSLIGAALLAAFAQNPPPDPSPPEFSPIEVSRGDLSRESKTLLRCSAAFAIVSHGQSQGSEAAQKWPVMGTRGREFFVRALAQLMDETALDREGISKLVIAEAQRLKEAKGVDEAMPACLVILDASGI